MCYVADIFLISLRKICCGYSESSQLALVSQLDGHSTGDQEVAGSIPTRSGNIFFLEIDHEIFSTIILSLLLIKKDSYHFLAKECPQILVNCLED